MREPIVPIRRRRLRVCSVARYSSEEHQRQISNVAQHRYNRAGLESTGITDYEWFEISDEGVSGERVDRPGIRLLYEGIARGEWDLILCEDSSRLYRNLEACLRLVNTAFDAGIRVICIGDDVDTAETDNWHDRLVEAQQHHTQSNKALRRRLRRAIENLWDDGYAVTSLRPGYRRFATVPATGTENEEGPYWDEIDPHWAPVVLKAFEMTANREPAWVVARYLTEQRLPKRDGKFKPWTNGDVVNLIRATIYRGLEQHGKTKATTTRTTGISTQERSSANEIRTREMEHLRIVSDALWFQANKVIDDRRKGPAPGTRDPYKFRGVPRDSRSPMGKVLFCFCKAKMYNVGKAYRCQIAHNHKNDCWNRATCKRALTHERICQNVLAAILNALELINVMTTYVAELYQDEDAWRDQERNLVNEIAATDRKRRNVAAAIKISSQELTTLVESLAELEQDFIIQTEKLQELRAQHEQPTEVPSREAILEAVKTAAANALDNDAMIREFLKRLLDGPILAVPYQQLNSNKIVLVAEFTLNLVGLLPAQLADALRKRTLDTTKLEQFKLKRTVELFDRPQYVKYAMKVLELAKSQPIDKIGNPWQIDRSTAKRARELAKAMLEAGINDPYVRLESAPPNASRWRKRRSA